MKITLIKNKKNHYDFKICDALTNINKKEIIEIDYSSFDAINISKKNDEYFNIILPEISNELNKINGVSFSLEFWRILIGPWLYKTIEFFHDKYILIKKLPKNKIFILKNAYFKKFRYIEVYDLYNDERFYKYSLFYLNQFLQINKKNISLNNAKISKNINLYHQKNSKIIKYLLKDLIRRVFNYFFLKKKYRYKILNMNIPLGSLELKKISDKYNNLYDNFLNKIRFNNTPITNNHINVVIKKNFNDEFLDSIKNLLNDWLPIEYGNDFKTNLKFYSKYLIKNNPKIILLRSPHESNIKIRFLTALFKEYKKSKIISFQEGGIGKYFYQKNYENYSLIGTDHFLQWSKINSSNNIHNFYVTKNFWRKEREYKIPDNDKILLVLGSFRKIFFSYYEGHLPDYSFIQLQQVTNLLKNIKILRRSVVRLHKDFGFNESKYLKKIFKNLIISNRKEIPYFYDLLPKFSLKIFFSDYTANMQSLIINHPTIFIWDKIRLKNNKIYDDVYRNLYKNNILFYSINKLEEFIDNRLTNSKEINKWWFSSNVQAARKEYILNICRLTNNIDKKLIKLINNII